MITGIINFYYLVQLVLIVIILLTFLIISIISVINKLDFKSLSNHNFITSFIACMIFTLALIFSPIIFIIRIGSALSKYLTRYE